MSSGGVAPWFWRETAIPLLLARYRRSASATFGRREESVGFFPEEFVALRPFLYHVLARENLAVLKATKTLWSTAALARRSGRTDILDACRRNSTGVRIPEGVVLVRDQKPLTMGNVEFESGWDAEDLLCDLNGRVFLWPGGHDGPIAYGRRHAESYESTDTLIRIPTWDIFDQAPVFSKYNSGSPRCNEGRKSPRGPDTFLPAERCNYRPGKVVEVAFVDVLFLPESTEWRPGPGTDWRALFRT
jgi:hypothetical protein